MTERPCISTATGTNALATAGTGDVLTGIIATLLSQRLVTGGCGARRRVLARIGGTVCARTSGASASSPVTSLRRWRCSPASEQRVTAERRTHGRRRLRPRFRHKHRSAHCPRRMRRHDRRPTAQCPRRSAQAETDCKRHIRNRAKLSKLLAERSEVGRGPGAGDPETRNDVHEPGRCFDDTARPLRGRGRCDNSGITRRTQPSSARRSAAASSNARSGTIDARAPGGRRIARKTPQNHTDRRDCNR